MKPGDLVAGKPKAFQFEYGITSTPLIGIVVKRLVYTPSTGHRLWSVLGPDGMTEEWEHFMELVG